MRLSLPALATAVLLAAAPASAQDVSFGGPVAGSNAFPFNDYHFLPANRYQQLYTGSQFGGPVLIDAIRFSNTASVAGGYPGSIASGNYLIRFAVTDRAENGLGTNFDANITGFTETFFSGTLAGGLLRIAGNPYLFDPSRGNLLMDVTVLSQDPYALLSLDFSRSATDGTSRVFNTFPLPPNPVTPGVPSVVRADELGLNTTFETRAIVATPEPASLALVAGGLGLLVVYVRRRRDA
jgi:hypothetical protein